MSAIRSLPGGKPDMAVMGGDFRVGPVRDTTRTSREPRGDPRSLVIRRRSILSRRLALCREEFSDLHPVVPQPRADLAPSLNARAWPWDVREWTKCIDRRWRPYSAGDR